MLPCLFYEMTVLKGHMQFLESYSGWMAGMFVPSLSLFTLLMRIHTDPVYNYRWIARICRP